MPTRSISKASWSGDSSCCVSGRLPASKGSLTEHAIVQAGAIMLSSYAASTRSVHVQLDSTSARSMFLYLA